MEHARTQRQQHQRNGIIAAAGNFQLVFDAYECQPIDPRCGKCGAVVVRTGTKTWARYYHCPECDTTYTLARRRLRRQEEE